MTITKFKLEVGKKYSTIELCTALGVTKDQWKRKKNEYLRNLSIAYNYDVEYQGRATFYTITEKICDYQKPERKNARKKTNDVIKKFINEVIDEDPVQTAANINRRAWEHSDTNPSSVVLLGLKDTTTGEYIRLNLREMYGIKENVGGTDGIIEKKIWCRLDTDYNCYIEIPQEMIDKFFSYLDKTKQQKREYNSSICADYKSGLISKQEMFNLLGESEYNVYEEASRAFREECGFWPIKVPVYIRCAWKDESENENKE